MTLAAERGALTGRARALTAHGVTPLTLSGIAKSWGAEPVLHDLDLRLAAGTVTWIGGRNGAGKTTMLRIAAGMIAPERGTVSALGLDPRRHRAAYQRLVSLLPAGDRGLYARLSVRAHLEFCARISLLPAGHAAAAVEHALTSFQLRELAARRVDRMSMGQRQRLRLAITMLSGPRLLLLDEPLTSLDADGAGLLLAAVCALREDGGAVLWCSPTGEQPELALDRTLMLRDGALAEL